MSAYGSKVHVHGAPDACEPPTQLLASFTHGPCWKLLIITAAFETPCAMVPARPVDSSTPPSEKKQRVGSLSGPTKLVGMGLNS